MPAKKSMLRPQNASSKKAAIPPDPGSKRGVSSWKEAATWLRARGIEVLLLHERIDDWAIGHLHEYAGKPLRHVGKGDLDLGDLDSPQDKEKREADAKAAAPLVEAVKGLLGDRVKAPDFEKILEELDWRAIFFYIALFAVLAGAQAVEQRQLDQGWEFRRISAGAGDEDPAGIGSAWRPASMPGTVHTDLLAHGLIPDPYVGAPEAGLQWIGLADWEYRAQFDVDAATLARLALNPGAMQQRTHGHEGGYEGCQQPGVGPVHHRYRQVAQDVSKCIEASQHTDDLSTPKPMVRDFLGV